MKIRKLLHFAVAACLAHGHASANPVGATVVSGGATFNGQGNLLTITNTPGTIINWQDFSIRGGETTRFVQQGATSAVLNRIVGQDPSQIFGALQSNGRVFLINPNGIVFGAGAQVDVNALVASTLNMTNEDFLAGRRVFNAGSVAGAIRNDGAITTPAGGQVYLIAPSIENNGIITSPRGEVLLAAGHQVQLVDSANPDLHVVVSAPDDHALNVGQIIASGGSIGIFGALINQRGVVNADSAVVGENGRIVFRASTQTMLEDGSVTSARGAGEGGTIHVLGDHVALTGDAQIDASGATGGGTVLVGGDFHGANDSIVNASATYLGAQTSIRADAIESGAGGRVAVWSDGATRAYGQISARGGRESGDGGFAEVSSHGFLDYRARTDLRATNGAAGMLLLDPNDVTIQDGPAPPTDIPSTGPPTLFSGGPASSILNVADLQSQLALGSVTVSTSGGTGGPSGGRITVANALGWSNGFSLILNADNGIAINGTITAQFDGRLLLNGGVGGITQSAPIDVTYLGVTSLGDVNLGSATNMVTNLAAQIGDGSHLNHNFTFLNGQALNVHNFSGLSGIAIATSGAYSSGASDGVIALRTTSGGITQSAGSLLAAKAVYAQGDSVVLAEANTASVIAGQSTQGFSYTSAGALDVGSVAGHSGIQGGDPTTFLTANGGDLTMSAPLAMGAGAAVLIASGAVSGNVTAGNVSAVAGNGITLVTQAQRIGATNTGGGNIAITNTGTLTIGQVTQSGGGSIAIDNTGPATVGFDQIVSSTTGSISITTHSPLTISGAVASTGGGAITLSAGPTGSVTDQLTLNGGIDIAAGTGVVVSTTGPIVLRAGDLITVTGPIAGNVMQQAFINVPVLPTLAQCLANAALPGCAAVLPTVAQCTVNSNLPGCFLVLPTVAQCTTTPTAAGCSVVLPTIAACTAAPTLPGCIAVLPTIAACAAAPTLAGCTAVLPTIAACTATPTLAGCSAVLPPVAQCATNPALPGCGAVLPTLAQCVATPSLAGCGAVLPSIVACSAAPSTPGCSAVLPSLAVCVTSPSIPGCSVVLPSLAACVSSPAIAGCSAILPSLATCAASPSTAGCSVVLPSLAACVSTPTLQGCSAVLPTLALCTSTPSLAGCAAVLPPVSLCAGNPSALGCAVVLPPVQDAGISTPLSQALNTTVNLINISVSVLVRPPITFLGVPVVLPRVPAPVPVGTSGGTAGGTTAPVATAGATSTPGATASTSPSDAKDDKKADDKKDVATADTGVKKDDAAKKMYCN